MTLSAVVVAATAAAARRCRLEDPLPCSSACLLACFYISSAIAIRSQYISLGPILPHNWYRCTSVRDLAPPEERNEKSQRDLNRGHNDNLLLLREQTTDGRPQIKHIRANNLQQLTGGDAVIQPRSSAPRDWFLFANSFTTSPGHSSLY